MMPHTPVLCLDRFAQAHALGPLNDGLAAALHAAWKWWERELQVLFLPDEAGREEYLAVWLGGKVAEEIEQRWRTSPGEAYCLHRLAAYLCIEAVGLLVPEVAENGCAPLPRLTPELIERLQRKNVRLNAERIPVWEGYGVLTYCPYQGGCPVCELRGACPKRNAGPRTEEIARPAGTW